LLADDGLSVAASSMAADLHSRSAVGIEFAIVPLLGRVVIAALLALADVPNLLESSLGISNLHGRGILRVRLLRVSIRHTKTTQLGRVH
jgi:hypothetical protein